MFENIRARAALALLPKKATTTAAPFQVIATHPADIAIYSNMTVRKATREGYKISVYVYRSVRTIIQAASAIPWIMLDKKGEPIENHPFTAVMAHPNDVFSGQDLIEFTIAHLELAGNSIWQPLIVGKTLREICPVMHDLV
ncbi:MAG: phage portal protein, partial [Bacteroidales bacterium]|nr:phage portal protein [Candidatus Latescibacterota bacterium]